MTDEEFDTFAEYVTEVFKAEGLLSSEEEDTQMSDEQIERIENVIQSYGQDDK